MAVTGLGHDGMSFKKFRSHSASSAALSKATNSASMVDRVVTVCFVDFHDTAAPPSVKIYPLVDLISVFIEIQFASQYPSKTGGYFVYCNQYSMVCFKYLNTLIKTFQ